MREVCDQNFSLRIDAVQDAPDFLLKLLTHSVGAITHKVIEHSLMEKLLGVISKFHENFRLFDGVLVLGVQFHAYYFEHLELLFYLVAILCLHVILEIVIE